MKKLYALMILLSMTLTPSFAFAEKLNLDGEYINLRTQKIDGKNYISLTDLEYGLQDTDAEFRLSSDNSKKIYITLGEQPDGYFEITDIYTKKNKMNTTTFVYLGKNENYEEYEKIEIETVEHDGETLVNLREIMNVLGYGIVYDKNNNTLSLKHSDLNITLYGAHWCPYCEKAENYLKGQGIAYRYVNTDTDYGKEKFAPYDEGYIPVLVINDEVIRDTSNENINKVLQSYR